MKVPIPLSDRVLVRPNKPAPKKSGRLQDPAADQEESLNGVIVSVGPQVVDLNLCEGIEVSWRKFSGSKINVNGEQLIEFREDELAFRWEDCP